jgi:hypothetical protein
LRHLVFYIPSLTDDSDDLAMQLKSALCLIICIYMLLYLNTCN